MHSAAASSSRQGFGTYDLIKALEKVEKSGRVALELTKRTRKFIHTVNGYGPYRYFEVSKVAYGADLVTLDLTVWELRRHCMLVKGPAQEQLREGFAAPRVRIPGGNLESVIDNKEDFAREPLLWQNAYFGKIARKTVRLKPWIKGHNAPLYLNPHILDEVLKYVYLPKDIEAGTGRTKGREKQQPSQRPPLWRFVVQRLLNRPEIVPTRAVIHLQQLTSSRVHPALASEVCRSAVNGTRQVERQQRRG
jgi:hypothetical protein